MISIISYTLGSSFPGAKVYTEQVKQIKRPAFFVRTLETVQDRRIGNLYTRLCSFVIRYHPPNDHLSEYGELDVIADKLYSVLEFMEFRGEVLRGYEMKHRIDDNTLQFFVTCRQTLRRPANDPLMTELETRLREKG